MNGLRAGSICTGYGGLDMAVHEVLSGELAWVADIDADASLVLAHRFPGVPNLGDITAVDWSSAKPVDVLTAGTPCQDVSQAGARAGLRHGTRSGVWHEAVRAIAELRPSLVVIENVLGLLTARGDEPAEEHLAAEIKRDTLRRLLPWVENEQALAASKGDMRRVRECRARAVRLMGLERRAVARCRWHERRLVRAVGTVLGTLASLGFDAEWAVLSAADAGACHLRKRVFVVAWAAADPGRGELQRRGVAGVLGGAEAGEPGEGDQRERAGHAAGDSGAAASPDAKCSASARLADASEWQQNRRTAANRNLPGVGTPVAAGRGAPAEDPDGAASGQRGLAAPGQAEGGGARADAGRPGGARAAADAHREGQGGAECTARRPGTRRRPAGNPAADPAGDGRQRRPEGAPGEADEPGEGPRAEAAGRGPGAPADAECGTRDGRPDEPVGGADRGDAAVGDSGGCGGRGAAADADGDRLSLVKRAEPGLGPRDDADGRGEGDVGWGSYAPAIARWEAVLGREAPRPTEPGRTGERLNPALVEWMMGLPDGWVTVVPGLSRNAQLRILGNGVVPAQAEMALRLLLARAGLAEAGEAA